MNSSPHRTYRLTVALFLAGSILGSVASGAPCLAAGLIGADFDWSMPDRFGRDDDGDGLVDYWDDEGEFRFTDDQGREIVRKIRPDGWRVDFDACASHGHIATYEWVIRQSDDEPGRFAFHSPLSGHDGGIVKRTAFATDGLLGFEPLHTDTTTECEFSWEFPYEGAFEVALTVTGRFGKQARIVKAVVVQDWLIVAMGDSGGSGEGVPDVPVTNELWERYDAAVLDLSHAQQHVLQAQQAVEEAIEHAEAALNHLVDLTETAASLVYWTDQVAQAWEDVAWYCNSAYTWWYGSSECNRAHGRHNHAQNQLAEAWAASDMIGDATQAYHDAVAVVAAASDAINEAQAAYDDAQAALGEAEAALAAAPVWQDELAHRSANAGQALAALEIERADPRTSVTFIHRSYTGRQVDDLVRSDNQIDQARRLAGDREIDAFLVSVGGNDVGIASRFTDCATQELCFEDNPEVVELMPDALPNIPGLSEWLKHLTPSTDQGNPLRDEYCPTIGHELVSSRDFFECLLSNLPNKYQSLQDKLYGVFDDYRPERLYLQEVMNMTQADDGSFCPTMPEQSDPTAALPGISQSEWEWLGTEMIPSLNHAMADATAAHGWNFIRTFDDFEGHGYCAEDRWIVRLDDSYYVQNGPGGLMHMNAQGHAVAGARTAEMLTRDFYPEGELGAPRHPATGAQH